MAVGECARKDGLMKSLRIVVDSGPVSRQAALVQVSLDGLLSSRATAARLAGPEGDVLCELDRRHQQVRFVNGPMAAGESREFALQIPAPGEKPARQPTSGMGLLQSLNGLEFTVDGGLFTIYRYTDALVRPVFHPVLAAGDLAVTRGFPMVDAIPGETTDHPHHRGIWVAHGDVNGADNWSEEPGHSRTIHRELSGVTCGSVSAAFQATADWVTPKGEALVKERRRVRIFGLPGDVRVLDLDVSLIPAAGPVTFGDTKEGGICSIRVATSMQGDRGGLITNADGGVGESQTWGWRSAWCDYSGPAGGRVVGIAILDSPSSFRHPVYWHVRDYGLMTANPFGWSHFNRDPSQNGAYTLQPGDSLDFRYRVLAHPGSAAECGIDGYYNDWTQPASVVVLSQ
jgi:hypothetical protein